MRRARAAAGIAVPIGVSALLHAVAVALMIGLRARTPPMPDLYRVEIIAAPAGPRAAGVVPPPTAPPPEPVAKPAPPPKGTARPAKTVAVPTRTKAPPPKPTKLATPVETPTPTPPPPKPPTPKTPPPTAGGGPTGDKGADVATVRTEGIAFPFPGYLNNIVRQIALNFRPRNPGALRCEVSFLIHRDGTVSNFRFLTRSGAYAFDLEAQGAIEAAAHSGAFGALPNGFSDDVLPVTFSFDPRLIR